MLRFFLSSLLFVLLALPAAAETWSTTTSDTGVKFAVRLHHPRLVRKVPLVDGMRWDLEVSNRARNIVTKHLASGPIEQVEIRQDRRYVRIVARWRFPYAMRPELTADRFSLFIPHTITRTSEVTLAEGVQFRRLKRWTPAGPITANVVVADLRHWALRPALAHAARGFGKETVGTMARRARALAAINGSFFSPGMGSPIGLLMLDGQIVSSSFYNRSVFGIRYDGTCFINNARLWAAIRLSDERIFIANSVNRPTARNQVILYTTHWGARTRSVPDPSRREFAIAPDGTILAACTGNAEIPREGYVVSGQGKAVAALLEQFHVGGRAIVYAQLSPEWQGVQYAVGGGPTLVASGRLKVTARDEKFSADIARGRAPRTAIGYRGGTSVVMVTVDGRQRASVGMTLYELGRLLMEHGVKDAINLDGGGSTAMVVRGRLVNSPSDGSERAVNNALVLVKGY